MSLVGAGLQPAGTSPTGIGVYSAAALPITQALPDFVTATPTTGRYINFQTKDYAFTPDGRFLGMGTTQQLVLLALTTVLGSSADPTLGQSYTSIQEKGADYMQQVQNAVQSALADVITRGLVTLDAVNVIESIANPNAAILQITWTDLATATQVTNSFGP